MCNQCVEELRSQAPVSEERGFTEVFDANAAVYISDTAVDIDTKMALRAGVAPLENVRNAVKDWHPGSDGKVLDLVHPSLYPLMYGISRFLREGIVPLEACVQFSGRGEIISCPRNEEVRYGYSGKHQWLPCEVRLDEKDNAVITSYINNLPPVAHKPLYQAIEQVITRAVPMWKLALYSTLFQYEKPRIDLQGGGYDHDAAEADYNARYEDGKRTWQREKDERKKEKAQNIDNNDCADEVGSDDDSDDESYCHDDDDFPDPYQDQYIELPDPETYVRCERKTTEEGLAKYEQMLAEKKLQVIVKLANIHLSPEKPSYDGGSWHIEVSYARGLNLSLSTDQYPAGHAQ